MFRVRLLNLITHKNGNDYMAFTFVLWVMKLRFSEVIRQIPFFFLDLVLFYFYHKIQIIIKQDSCTKANESGEEAQKKNHGAYRHWAPTE